MIIGTAGHIDHGKTALVGALTGVDTDRLKEEKARGISIDLGFAYLPASDGTVLGFVDVPGHERFVRNMLAGATGIDFVLLVVAADDGMMPQTIEHLAIVDLLHIRRGVVALTKADLADEGRGAELTSQIRDGLSGTCLADADILPVSSLTGEGIDALRNRLFAEARQPPSRHDQGRFRLAIDRSFTLKGTGTVATGTVLSGQVVVGDRLTLSPSGLAARVRSIHAQNRETGTGRAGQRCALNLAGDQISKEAVSRGDIVLDPALHAPTKRIDATLKVLASEAKPVAQWTPVHLHHAAAEVSARIVLLDKEPIAPGREALVQLVLDQPLAAAAGDGFVVRDTTAQRTMGGGRFLDLRGPIRKRGTPERLAQLDALKLDNPAKMLAGLLELPPFHVDLSAFARDHALAEAELAQMARRLAIVAVQSPHALYGLSPRTETRFKRSLLATLEIYHADYPDLPGMGIEQLRLKVEPRLPLALFGAILQALAPSGDVALDGAWVRLPQHTVKLTDADAFAWAQIRPMLAEERFRPPRVRDIAGLLAIEEGKVRRLLKLLSRLNKVDEVAHDHFFLRNTVAEMVASACELAGDAENGQFAAAQFRDRVNSGRKVAIQILEFFDRHGVTLRKDDLRRINKHRLDLFRPVDEDAESATPNPQRPKSLPVARRPHPLSHPPRRSAAR